MMSKNLTVTTVQLDVLRTDVIEAALGIGVWGACMLAFNAPQQTADRALPGMYSVLFVAATYTLM